MCLRILGHFLLRPMLEAGQQREAGATHQVAKIIGGEKADS